MNVVILGNAGSGKTTLAKRLMRESSAACLPLDEVAFAEGATRRPLEESVSEVKRFIADHEHWIIEGCYGDLVERILDDCDELIFLNPAVETCVQHCRLRPWEPEKFASKAQQDENLENLIDWVRAYETRQDEFGLARHRSIYDAFRGQKRELTDPRAYVG